MFKTNGPTFDLRLYNKGSHSIDDIAALDDLNSVEFSVIPTSDLKNQADIDVLRYLQDILKYKDREFGSEINDLLTNYRL